MATSVRQSIALGILGIGFVFGVLGLFFSWWSADFQEGGFSADWFSTRPYSADSDLQLPPIPGLDPAQAAGFERAFNEPFEETNDANALITGALVTTGLLGVAGAIGLIVGSYFVPGISAVYAHLGSGLAVLVGIAAVVLAPLTWPDELADDMNARDPDGDVRVEGKWQGEWHPEGEPDSGISYSTGLGWYFTMAGLIAAPLGAATYHLSSGFTPGPEPTTTQLGPAAAPPPLPARPAPPAPTYGSYKPGASAYGSAPAPPPLPAPRAAAPPPQGSGARLSVVKKSGPGETPRGGKTTVRKKSN